MAHFLNGSDDQIQTTPDDKLQETKESRAVDVDGEIDDTLQDSESENESGPGSIHSSVDG